MSRKDERKKKDAGKRQRILTYVCAALIALVVLLIKDPKGVVKATLLKKK